MKKSVIASLVSVLILSGCGGSETSSDTSGVKGTHIDVNLPLEEQYGSILNLKGFDSLTVEIENNTRRVAYANSVLLDVLAKASGQSADSFAQILLNSAISGAPLTIGNLGEVNVTISNKNGGVGYVITSSSFDVTFPSFPLIETMFSPRSFGYSEKSKELHYEFSVNVSTKDILYSRFKHGNTVYSYNENSQGDHQYIAHYVDNGYTDIDITHVANTQEVKVSEHGSSTRTGHYNSSTDTISGL